jgi:flagellar basal-body rod protein FlgG
MFAQELKLDNISNNLANVNTTGFKKSEVQFQDLMYQVIRPASASFSSNVIEPVELSVGHGVRPIANTRSFMQGTLTQTENPLDLAINGEGFFQVLLPDGTEAYTRDGQLQIDPDGRLVTSNGYELEPRVDLPPDTEAVIINRDGTIMALTTGQSIPEEIGQIEMARFINPAGLTAIGQNLFQETISSGPPIRGEGGLEGFGQIEQGYLEASNVSVVEEMIDMITAQRAYELNSKAIKTAENMLERAVNLKR